MKFIHAADIHLDSPLRGLERYEGAPVEAVRGATRAALENLVDLCIEEAAGLLLIAGDLYDGDWRDHTTGLFFVAQMARLTRQGVRVALIRGNHDAASQITKKLRLPDGVFDFSTAKPETRRFDDLGMAVHGRGYAHRETSEDLAAGYPAPLQGVLNIGLLHTALDGRPGHQPYAPTTADALAAHGYDYWALGHVHGREVVRKDPWIVFPGNLQGRHARETGPKGATVVTVEDGLITLVEERVLDVVRWIELEIDATGARNADEVVERVRSAVQIASEGADGRILAARLRIVGETPAHAELVGDLQESVETIRAAVLDLGSEAWIEKIRFETHVALDVEAMERRVDAVGSLVRSLRDLRTDNATLESIVESIDASLGKVPREFFEEIDLGDAATLRDLLAECENLVLPRLIGIEEDPR